MFGTLGGPELFLIFVVALIVFGPRKLPEIGKQLGKMMGEFRRASNEFRSTIESEVEAEKIREAMRIEPPKIEPATPPPVEASSSPATVGYPDAAEPPPTDAPATEPAAEATAVDTPAPEPVPETVSRHPDNAAIEPK